MRFSVYALLIATILLSACGPARLPDEAGAKAFLTANDYVRAFWSKAGLSSDEYSARVTAANFHVKNSAPAPLTVNEQNDGRSDAWCVRVDYHAQTSLYTRDDSYQVLVMQRLGSWVGALDSDRCHLQ